MAMNARGASTAIRAIRVRYSHTNVYLTKIANASQPLAVRPAVVPAFRSYSTSEPDLKTTFKECIPAKRELLKKVKALGGKVIGQVKVENTIGGMRYETKNPHHIPQNASLCLRQSCYMRTAPEVVTVVTTLPEVPESGYHLPGILLSSWQYHHCSYPKTTLTFTED
jgi:hypothetical protein